MSAIVWSPRALSDVESIRDYVGLDSPTYADLVIRRIVDSVERLSTFPPSGRVVPEIDRIDVREIIVRPYRVVYRVRARTAAAEADILCLLFECSTTRGVRMRARPGVRRLRSRRGLPGDCSV